MLPRLSAAGSGTTLVELVIPPHDLADQLKRLAELLAPVAKYRKLDTTTI